MRFLLPTEPSKQCVELVVRHALDLGWTRRGCWRFRETFAMFQDPWVKHRDWVFAPVGYAAVDELVQGLDMLIKRAQARSAELVARKAERVKVERMRDLLGAAGPTR